MLLRSDLREHFKVIAITRQSTCVDLREFPERAETRQGRTHATQAALRLQDILRQVCEIAGEEPRGIEFELGDGLDGLGTLFACFDVNYGSRTGLLLGLCCNVALITFNDVGVLDKVAEDEPVHAVSACGVKWLLVQAGGDVDEVEGCWIKVCSNDYVKGGKVAWDLGGRALGVDKYAHSWVQLLNIGACCLSTVFANRTVFLREEELGAQVGFGNDCAVEDGERADSSKNKVLCDLIRETT